MPSAPKQHRYVGQPTQAERHAAYDARRKADPGLAMAAELRGSTRWRNYRAWFVARHPMCCNPFGIAGHLRGTQDVHHIVEVQDAPDRLCDESNTVPLCRECHARVSALERAGRQAEARRLFDGWRIDDE